MSTLVYKIRIHGNENGIIKNFLSDINTRKKYRILYIIYVELNDYEYYIIKSLKNINDFKKIQLLCNIPIITQPFYNNCGLYSINNLCTAIILSYNEFILLCETKFNLLVKKKFFRIEYELLNSTLFINSHLPIELHNHLVTIHVNAIKNITINHNKSNEIAVNFWKNAENLFIA